MTETTPAASIVGDEVRAMLARRRIQQATLCERTGISSSSLHRRLLGVQSFTVTEIVKVAEVLGVSVTELLGPLDDLLEQPAASA